MSRKNLNKEITNYDEYDDVEMAFELQQRYNPLGLTENAVFSEIKNNGNYQPRTLIDQTLEIIDPTPNIYTLFGQFNERFFCSKLLSVEVKWSQRMTSCAGVCSFDRRNRACIISLSAPLLVLRPRKDLVETLLHEMIHGYLFLTNNNRDRDGHGPEFCKIMNRINKEAGTQITIYHSFHDEVRVYQQHWWRCDGPCNKQPPYFGMVRRAMNRAPGPNDSWWYNHRLKCNGNFVKVREPENKSKKKKPAKDREISSDKNNTKQTATSSKSDKNLDDWFTRSGGKSGISATTRGAKSSDDYQTKAAKKSSSDGLVKLGTSTNNVHGWGTAGPSNSSSSSSLTKVKKSNNDGTARSLNFNGKLGGAATGRSNLLDKFLSPSLDNRRTKHEASSSRIKEESPPSKKPKIIESSKNNSTKLLNNDDSSLNRDKYDCPICQLSIDAYCLNQHLDACLIIENGNSAGKRITPVIDISDSPDKLRRDDKKVPKTNKSTSTTLRGQTNLDNFVISPRKNMENIVSCPVCDKKLLIRKFNYHLDKCLLETTKSDNNPGRYNIGQRGENKRQEITGKNYVDSIDAATSQSEPYLCLVCHVKVNGDIALNDHLEECVEPIFNDDTFDIGNESIEEISSFASNDKIVNEKFPCPICTLPIRENMMDSHLDECLLRMENA